MSGDEGFGHHVEDAGSPQPSEMDQAPHQVDEGTHAGDGQAGAALYDQLQGELESLRATADPVHAAAEQEPEPETQAGAHHPSQAAYDAALEELQRAHALTSGPEGATSIPPAHGDQVSAASAGESTGLAHAGPPQTPNPAGSPGAASAAQAEVKNMEEELQDEHQNMETIIRNT